METLAWILVTAQLLTTAASAAHLTRRHRHDPAQLPRTIHRTAPFLLLTGVLPLAALLPIDALALLWGLWGVGYTAAALVYAAADTNRDLPRARAAARSRGTTAA
ncbi:hypothetical protein GCM10019016_079170 [Streptomyces prasinosporus]|jgi:hypothetical protein|uniref:Uncharacterized protein n=2 Tax=Streptomyces TaxID=1883 RepID=A0ABP6U1G3_9ACTN|nr:hypothetical protein [Streptomyces tricolor]MCG0062751.1 hypothetical protein [Streptomyces tricolor]GHC13742.1 hypothetical protein GCM10010332_49390 [Streptomyces albogriseolus]